jgi:hypothetical protein
MPARCGGGRLLNPFQPGPSLPPPRPARPVDYLSGLLFNCLLCCVSLAGIVLKSQAHAPGRGTTARAGLDD